VDSAPNTDYAYWVSQNVFSMYQLMFAIITPALIVGAIARAHEVLRHHGVHHRSGCSSFYFRSPTWLWGVTGYMNGVWNAGAGHQGQSTSAGGTVVASPRAGRLILCLILGPRLGFGKTPMPPHSMVLCMVGTGMLWVGWYGFKRWFRGRRGRGFLQRLQ